MNYKLISMALFISSSVAAVEVNCKSSRCKEFKEAIEQLKDDCAKKNRGLIEEFFSSCDALGLNPNECGGRFYTKMAKDQDRLQIECEEKKKEIEKAAYLKGCILDRHPLEIKDCLIFDAIK